MSVIRLDLAALLAARQVTPEEAARLTALALPGRRGSLAANLLLIFGAIAVAAATVALVPNPATGLALALGALAGAEALRRLVRGESFVLLAAALALMGTLGLAGWVAWEFREVPATRPALLITGLLAASALWHASYALFVEEPALTIAVFGLLAAGLYRLRRHVPESAAPLATVAARTALVLVHLAFWVGSLWGDRLGGAQWPYENAAQPGLHLAPWIFAAGWAGLSLALAVATRRGGFLSVSAAVFLAIHGYTQYFETFGAEPFTLLIAGLVLIGLAIGAARLLRGRRAD